MLPYKAAMQGKLLMVADWQFAKNIPRFENILANHLASETRIIPAVFSNS